MCVIAGFIGDLPAAPVLLDMLRREQGMGGGYYTGIATLSEGTLHVRKVLGDLDTLLERTDAAQLPGTVGIAHSRSKSGGEDEWSHPFIDQTERLAYIANGAEGFFRNKVDLASVGNDALARGETFRTAVKEAVGSYPVLADGSCVHMSEVMAHEIAHRFATGARDLADAMAGAYRRAPSELVGLCIHADRPDAIGGCRLNMPMIFGRGPQGMFAATTALAFPPETDWELAAPANSAVMLARESVRISPLADPPAPVEPAPSVETLAQRIAGELKGAGPCTFGRLCEVAKGMWPEGSLNPRGMVVFEVLRALDREGRLRFEEERVPGQYDRGTAPLTKISWRESA